MGIMGFNSLRTSLQVPGVRLGRCDLYTGRPNFPKNYLAKISLPPGITMISSTERMQMKAGKVYQVGNQGVRDPMKAVVE